MFHRLHDLSDVDGAQFSRLLECCQVPQLTVWNQYENNICCDLFSLVVRAPPPQS